MFEMILPSCGDVLTKMVTSSSADYSILIG